MVIIISGTPAAGKSSVSKKLATKFERSAYISVDLLRHMVVKGLVLPWEENAHTQIELGEKNVMSITQNFLDAGFVVIIDDVMIDQRVKKFIDTFKDTKAYLLLPSLGKLKERDLKRPKDEQLGKRIDDLYPKFANAENKYMNVIDSTDQTLDETVDQIYSLITNES